MISRRERELLSPHKISVVLLIEKFATIRHKYWNVESEKDKFKPIIMISPRARKAMCILISKLIQGRDLSLSELLELVESSLISNEQINAFTSGLHELYKNGVENLLTLFDAVEKYCIQDQIRSESYPCLWTSLVGLHLRQLNLSFRRLGFSHVISLFKKFTTYYEECYKSRPLMLEDPQQCDELIPHNVTDCQDVEMEHEINYSCSDTFDIDLQENKGKEDVHPFSLPCESKPPEKALSLGTRQQAELFIQEQITLLLQQNSSAMPPAELQAYISTLLKNCPELGKAHFLSYLNCLRVREQTGAIHNLVRAYDSKFMHKEAGRGEDITRTFRYAALNMAALQTQFNHRELGLMYLEEAIRLAQESNDHICLQYALAWLYTLSPVQKATLMKRSLIRSSEMNLSSLSWVSLLNYAKELSRSKISPSELLKKLLGPGNHSISNQNGNTNLLEGGLAGQPGLWAVQTGLWSLWGNIHLTAICSQLVLRMTPQLTGSIHTPSTVSPNCAALCNMTLILANLGEVSLCSELLQHAQQWFPPPWEHSKLWMISKCYISFYEVLRQGLWSQAKAVAVDMATVHPTYSKLLEAELLVTKGEYSEALKEIYNLKHKSAEAAIAGQCKEPEIIVKTFLTESEALAGGNNLGGALATLVKAISFAQDYHLTYLAALGYLHMSSIQLHIGLLNEANASFQKGLDVILSGGGIYDQARTRLLQAKLEVRSASKSDCYEKLCSASETFEIAQKLFVKVKAYTREKETVYLKARLYHACGNLEARNKSALEFRQLELQHPSHPIVANTCLF